MEFFDLFNVPMFFMNYIINLIVKPDIQNIYDYCNVSLSCYLFAALGTLGVYLILLVFGGIGLNKLAKKQGLKHRWMAFLPFFNTYYAGKLAGETQFFGQKMKRVGLYAMISEILYVALQLFVFVAVIMYFFPEYLTLVVENGEMKGEPNDSMPAWIMPAIDYGRLVAYLLWFFVIVFFCVLYVSFFRKYYARGPILLAFLSAVLPFRGFTIFAVRNNAPVDYNDYIRRRTQAYMRGNGYNQPPYSPYGPGNGGYGSGGPQNDDPFEGFGGPSGGSSSGSSSSPSSDDDPFSEFGDDKK